MTLGMCRGQLAFLALEALLGNAEHSAEGQREVDIEGDAGEPFRGVDNGDGGFRVLVDVLERGAQRCLEGDAVVLNVLCGGHGSSPESR